MFRSLVLVLLSVAAFSAGCAQAEAPVVEGPDDVQESLLTTARSIHNEQVNEVSSPEETIGGGSGVTVELASGEPTSTEPFAMMSAIVRGLPGESNYRLTYFVPEPRPDYPDSRRVYSYEWDRERGMMIYYAGDDDGDSNTLVQLGAVSAEDATYLQRVGAGEEELPAFKPGEHLPAE